jgi:hypothetical protein
MLKGAAQRKTLALAPQPTALTTTVVFGPTPNSHCLGADYSDGKRVTVGT